MKGLIFILVTFFSINTSLAATAKASESAWDFDHQIHFKQTTLTDNTFRLEAIPNSKINFERMAAFLLRKSLKLCQGKHYNLQIIKGIESYNNQEYFPNRLAGSLVAEISCIN